MHLFFKIHINKDFRRHRIRNNLLVKWTKVLFCRIILILIEVQKKITKIILLLFKNRVHILRRKTRKEPTGTICQKKKLKANRLNTWVVVIRRLTMILMMFECLYWVIIGFISDLWGVTRNLLKVINFDVVCVCTGDSQSRKYLLRYFKTRQCLPYYLF